ncbi:Mu transposase C-terminal domain-containing protein [Bosea vaviloviae]|uniref:Integrase n=1 Tax=Bosea vaviloviae TaxID=1526658 RepID=A0A0N1F4Q3_9HYPH|nr:Mu transposase C-terminal domain-containing protein [Bosea vaviloviae]KPH80551.1 hypothetical protein AE618_12315 [Bosea vaviloviae]
MKMWLTSSELADLALPGLPTTRKNVVAMAERENWARFTGLCRPRAGRGGGVEYHINLLPIAARVAYRGVEAPQSDAAEAIQAAPEPAAGESRAATLQLDARLAVLGALKGFIRTSGLKQTVAVATFVDLYNLGRVEIPAWAAAVVGRLSNRTLLRWMSAAREGETARLAVDKGAGRRGQGVLDAAFDGEIKHFALAVHSFNDLYTARQIHEAVEAKFGAQLAAAGLKLPGQRAFEQRFKAWKQDYAAGLLQMTDPDAYRSRMRVSGSHAHRAPHLNALWQIDASPVDALCSDGRHSIYVCIDIWSRRLMLYVSKTPRSEAVQMLMRKAILAWGVPDAVKTDNGSDFIARATVRLFAKLDIEAIRSDAFSPWQKGFVERHIRTFQTDCSRTLPGFIGHNVAQRQRIRSRKGFSERLGQSEREAFPVTLTGAELQAECDAWAERQYAHRKHGGIGEITPFARAASSTRPIRTVDADALASLLMPAPDAEGIRTVGKNGVRIGGFHYLAPGLVVGDRVFVRLDPHDAGLVWLFDEQGDNLLARGFNVERSGVDRAALVAETRARQKSVTDERMKDVRESRKAVTERTVLDLRRQLAEERVGNLVAFPPRSEIHSTPALDAGLEIAAIRRGGAPTPQPLSPQAAGLHAEIEADMAAGWSPDAAPTVITPLRTTETAHQRFRRAQELEQRIADGVALETQEAVWLGGYQTSAEYRAHRAIADDFGEAALR